MTDLFNDVPRGNPEKDARHYTAPASRFMSLDTLRTDPRFAWKPGRFFLGVVDGKPQKDNKGVPYVTGGRAIGVDDNRHAALFAGSRTGKGRACICTNLLHYPGSALVTDPKNELATITARARKEMGHAVRIVAPFFKPADDLAAGFNCIEAMRDGQLVEDASLISDAIVVSNDKDPHFDESARTYIETGLLHVRTANGLDGQRNLFTLRKLLCGKAANLDLLRIDMEKNTAAGGVIQAGAADFFDRPDKERGSVLSTVRRHLKFIDLLAEAKNGKRTVAQHDFNLSDLKTKPTTVYLCLPNRHMGTCSRWLRLFVNLTLQSMEQTHAPILPGGVSVLCILEEFASLGTLRQVEIAAGAIAGEGCRLWFILQDMGQLKALYSDRWETFLGNSGIVQVFGNTDLTTLDWITKRCGRVAIRVPQAKALTVGQIDAGDKAGWSTEVYDLLGVDETARLFGRDDEQCRQLVLFGGLPPMLLQRAYYDKHALFQGLFDHIAI